MAFSPRILMPFFVAAATSPLAARASIVLYAECKVTKCTYTGPVHNNPCGKDSLRISEATVQVFKTMGDLAHQHEGWMGLVFPSDPTEKRIGGQSLDPVTIKDGTDFMELSYRDGYEGALRNFRINYSSYKAKPTTGSGDIEFIHDWKEYVSVELGNCQTSLE